MNAAKRFLMVAAAFALATLVFMIANPKAVHAFAATLVQVVNTPSNPVPVAGTLGIDPNNNGVQIASVQPVKVVQNGIISLPVYASGSVGIDPNSNSVNIGNPTVNLGGPVQLANGTTVGISGNDPSNPLLVRDLDNGPRQAVALSAYFNMPDGSSFANGVASSALTKEFKVPVGKRLVIENISASLTVPDKQGPTEMIVVGILNCGNGCGSSTIDNLVPSFVGTDGIKAHYVANQPVKIYEDAGNVVYVSASRNSTTGTAVASFVLNGYLLDCGNGGCPAQP